MKRGPSRDVPDLAKDRKDTPLHRPPTPLPTPNVTASTSCSKAIHTSEVRYLINVDDKVWAAERDGPITVRSNETGQAEATLDSKGSNFCWCLLLCESVVWAGFSGGQIRIYDVESQTLVKELMQHAGGVYCLAYSHGHVYSGSNDFQCIRWHAMRFDFVHQYSGHRNSVRCVHAFAATLITGSDDHTIRVWDIPTGTVLQELCGHRGGVLALLRDGSRLWSASEDGTIHVWTWEAAQPLAVLSDHKGRVTSLTMVGPWVCSGGVDRNINYYDRETLQCQGTLRGHEGYVTHLLLLGTTVQYHLWSASGDRTLRCWTLEGPFQRAGQEVLTSTDKDDATPLNRMLEKQVEELKGQLQALHNDHAASLGQRDAKLAELQRDLADAQDVIAKADVHRQHLENTLHTERAAVNEWQTKGEEMRKQLEAMDAAMNKWKKERDQMVNHYKQLLREKDQQIDEKQAVVIDLQKRAAQDSQQIIRLEQELRQAMDHTSELQSRCHALTRNLDAGAQSQAELLVRQEKLKSEISQQKKDLHKAQELVRREEQRAMGALQQMADMEGRLTTEAMRCAALQNELEGSQEQVAELKRGVSKLEGKLRQHEILSQAALQKAVELEHKTEELELEKQHLLRQESEFQFVIQSRSELVRQIWDLFNDLGDAQERFKELMILPSAKHLQSAKDHPRVEAMVKSLGTARDRNKRIVCNYFTEVEKFHVGASPYFFPPDQDFNRYQVLENNIDALRRLRLHDVHKTGTLTAVREKPLVRRCNSLPQVMDPSPTDCDQTEGKGRRQTRLRSSVPKPPTAPRPQAPVWDKRSPSPRLPPATGA